MSIEHPSVVIHRLTVTARDCQRDLGDHKTLVAACRRAADHAGLSAVGETIHAFVPHGLTVALLLAQSHLLLSTWPEYKVVTVDLAVCTKPRTAHAAWEELKAFLRPARVDLSEDSVMLYAA